MFKSQKTRQADVLEVISNLSSDEVFTPPKVVNEMLDLLPEEVWCDPSSRWLDPGTKTGVFLREITRRLMVGLEGEIPDEQQRLQHILKEMVFGIAITELTALMARRTLYCSKDASSERSLVEMPTSEGNIWFERTEHDFNDKGRCTECGASKDQIERGEELENYAYGFIHADGRKKIEEVMEMRFDVIVGNPPYQMTGGGGGTNDTPLYNQFVDAAISLVPRHLVMITPARWLAGGRGLGDYRLAMLSDRRMREMIDYPDPGDLFPGVLIAGGLTIFHWDSKYLGDCRVTQVKAGEARAPAKRNLSEFDVFVRDPRGVAVLRKILDRDEAKVIEMTSGDTPFGLPTNFADYHLGKRRSGEILVHGLREGRRVAGWMARSQVVKNADCIDDWKVIIPKASGVGKTPDQVLGRPEISSPPSVCTQTFLWVGPFGGESEANSFLSYVQTRFFRFLVSLRKISQDAFRSTYTWVPQQAWDREWTDEELYEKYGITKKEQAYIAEMIKEMPSE